MSPRMSDAAKDAFRELKGLGVMRVVILTGDNEAMARAVGKDAGEDEVRAGLPEEKVAAVEVWSPSSARWRWSATE